MADTWDQMVFSVEKHPWPPPTQCQEHPQLWQPQMFPNITNVPWGTDLSLVDTHWSSWFQAQLNPVCSKCHKDLSISQLCHLLSWLFPSTVFHLLGTKMVPQLQVNSPHQLNSPSRRSAPLPQEATKVPGKVLIGSTSVTCPCSTNCDQVMKISD